MASSKKTRILILGGGFAVLHAAIQLDDTLARDPTAEITLVNPLRAPNIAHMGEAKTMAGSHPSGPAAASLEVMP